MDPQSRLWRLAIRLRPAIATAPTPAQQVFDVSTVALVLLLLPTALIAAVWLALASEWSVLADHLPLFGLLLGVLVLVARYEFTIYIELANGELLQTSGSLGDIITFSAALIFGPTALLIDVARQLIGCTWIGIRAARVQQSALWAALTAFMQGIGRSTLAALIALAVYRALGGTHPPADLGRATWIAAAAAVLVVAALETGSALLVVYQMNRLIRLVSPPQALGQWARLVIAASLLNAPFPVLGALIYTAGSTALYLLFVAGVVLVNFLAYTLSRAVERSTQRARELAALEALGEAIIAAPPDLSTLPDLLQAHISRMFPQDRLEIKLFDLPADHAYAHQHAGYHLHTAEQRAPLAEDYWDHLRASAEPYLALPALKLPTTHLPGSGIMCKIMADDPGSEGGEKEAFLGGISLLRVQTTGSAATSLPALQALASQIGSAFYRARVHHDTLIAHAMSQELALAGQIQAKFLPTHIPHAAGWDIATRLIPARQTSGDFYDVIELPDQQLALVVADVADKGTGAALFMALSRTLIRSFAVEHPASPCDVLDHTNARILSDADSDQFVTVFYGVLDRVTGVLTYANAGHNPGFVLRAGTDPALQTLAKTGAPLGIMDGLAWQSDTVQLHPGDTLVLYTDGISEAQDLMHREFGEERLIMTARSALHAAHDQGVPPALCVQNAIIDAVRAFVATAPQFDDITLMVVARA